MSSTDFRQLSTKELHLYMNLVMGFCKDIRRMLREGTLTKDAIDKYEVTVSNNILTEVNRRSGAETSSTIVRSRLFVLMSPTIADTPSTCYKI